MNGYFEWEEKQNTSQPFYLRNKDEDEPLMLACLYNNVFTEKIGEEYNHFVVLTMEAKDNIKKIHHRMPVVLDEKTKDMWLNPNITF